MPAAAKRGVLRRVFTTDHHVIGLQYGVVALAAVAVGTTLSLLMRIHLAWPELKIPGWGAIKPEDYLALVTMHGTLMVFFVLTVAPQSTFGNLFLPAQIGARRMALPWLNAAGLWGTVLALIVLVAAFFVPLGAPIGGWSAYAPLSALAAAGPGQGWGMDCWLASIAIFCVASSCGAVNFLATVSRERCRGMRLGRMPLTVWSWWVSAMLILLSFSVLLAALLLLFCDRHSGTHFFVPSGLVVSGVAMSGSGDGSPLLWQHLFWFFGHPEVYIAILPAMGLTTTLIANFTRRRLTSYRGMVFTTLAIAFLGIVVWGHHMFVSGMNPYAGSAFALTTMAIAIPSSAKVLVWLRMLWNSRSPRRDWMRLPMLFSLGFLSFFIAGGLTGPILAQPMLDSYLHNTYFVLAHFHLIMGMAAVFGIFAATYYWFPLMTGRQMNGALGQAHFWLSLVGAYGTFLPMHIAGLAGLPRHYAQLASPQAAFQSLQPLQRAITYCALLLIGAQLLFLVNVAWSWRRGKIAGGNPWGATTLEWAPAEWFSDAARSVVTGPYEYGGASVETDSTSGDARNGDSRNGDLRNGGFQPQWRAAAEGSSLPGQQE
jgi:cytochrome c oxidase subunit I